MSDADELEDILNELKNMSENKEQEKEDSTLFIDEKPKSEVTTKSPEPELTLNETERVSPIPVDIDSFNSAEKVEKSEEKEETAMSDNAKKKNNNNKKPLIIAIAAVVVVAIIVAVVVGVKLSHKEEPTTTTQPITTAETTSAVAAVDERNPLTGSKDFKKSAVGKRPIACVVENSYAARPQWGIADDKNPPDIIVEGEVEGGETRMLFMYADYTSVPSQIGPMRSARPPYIRFSEMFDAIFIHWGMSKTKQGTNYIGANTVFKQDHVDHINQMTYGGGVALFGRDGSRGVSMEHTGVLYGDKIAEAIKGEGFRRKYKSTKFTRLNFAETETTLSDKACNALALTFSSRTATRDWSYSESDKMYHCNDYQTDVARKNLLVLFDKTEYIAKANYKNSGSAEIYCDYKLSGGEGVLASNGTVIDIVWSKENGLLVIKDKQGNDVSFNVGTTWIGYASSNNGGAVSTN